MLKYYRLHPAINTRFEYVLRNVSMVSKTVIQGMIIDKVWIYLSDVNEDASSEGWGQFLPKLSGLLDPPRTPAAPVDIGNLLSLK